MEYVFFWRTASPFSNWHPAKFEIDGVKFHNTEQHMMWSKAVLMNDMETANKILATSDPRTIKALGREVKNFKSDLWDKVKFEVVFNGCKAKFTQNEKLKKALLDTGDKKICEASPYDKIWGLALDEESAKKIPESEWPGQNLLGKILMKVREDLKNK
jgi:hypothetical protein